MKISIIKLTLLVMLLLRNFAVTHGMDSTQVSWPEIQTLNNNCYIGKLPGQNLWAVMEPVNAHNIDSWKKYVVVQLHQKALLEGNKYIPGFINGDGSRHFKMVLNHVSYTENELWIAYIVGNLDIVPMTNEYMEAYDIDQLINASNPFAKNVYMYVTVTSSPNALISSHMGISASVEGLIQDIRGLSIYLSSLGAKVMLMRNPNRKHMVHAPNLIMEEKLVRSLHPNTVFAGTKEMITELEVSSMYDFDGFKNAFTQDIEVVKAKVRGKSTSEWPERFSTWSYLKTSAQILIDDFDREYITEEEYSKDCEVLINKYLQFDDLNFIFKWYSNPFPFREWKPVKDQPNPKTIKELLKLYPPLLSVDGPRGNRIKNKITIFNNDYPNEPWLVIDKNNPDYNWIFTNPFAPCGCSHYIVFDLIALANAKPLDIY